MKIKRNREINIFNISAVDLFASSFGAFLLITLMLMPYYLKVDRSWMERATRLQEQVRQQQQQIESLQRSLRECEGRLQTCQAKLNATFLLVTIKWDAKPSDVDLHIFDPSGAHFFHARKLNPGRPGALTEDDRGGVEGRGGNNFEMWSIFQTAPAGDYAVVYDLYAGNPANVTGKVMSRDGEVNIPRVGLSSHCMRIGFVTVAGNGGVSFRSNVGALPPAQCKAPQQ